MKITKMSLVNIQGKLSRTEMKKIMAGSSGGYKCCWDNAPSNCSDCVPGARPECVAKASPVAC